MRRTDTKTSRLLLGLILALGLVFVPVGSAAAATVGLNVTPATLTIQLPAKAASAKATFSLTNSYASPISLTLTIHRSSANTAVSHEVTENLSLSRPTLVLAPGQTVEEILTLTDGGDLPPGSQLAGIVIAQAAAGGQVTVGAAVTIPVITIKSDGAVQSLGKASFALPHLNWQLPGTLGTSLTNTGNTLVIPHGYVTLQAPNGQLVSKGVLNVASIAINPKITTHLNATLSSIHSARWPGVYTATLSYGLGNGQPNTTLTSRLIYVAWWHLLIALGLAVGVVYALRHIIKTLLAHRRQV